MKRFRVDVPFRESDHTNPTWREFVEPVEVAAEDWLTALEKAVEQFNDRNQQDYHSWICQVMRDRVEVTDLTSGKRFHVSDSALEPANESSKEDVELSVVEDSLPHADLLAILRDEKTLEASSGPVLDLAMKALGAEAGSVLLLDPTRQDLYFQEARGEKADSVMKFRVELGVGIAGWCALRGENLAVFDAPAHPRFYKAISQEVDFETRSILCAPMRVGGKVLGVVEVLNVATKRVSRPQINFLESCARVLAVLPQGKTP